MKDRPYTIRWEALREASRILAWYASKGGGLVVVHGGGSFGHAEAERLQALHGGSLPGSAAPRIQAAMLRLAVEVASALVDAGVGATLHTTHTLCGCGGCEYAPISRDYSSGLVPVLYGDALACGGSTLIVSGDRLVVEAAESLGVECVVYVIDKPGILDSNGKPLAVVRAGEEPPLLGGGAAPDVTGGLRAKLEWAYRAALRGFEVYITGLDGLLKVLSGGTAPTRIEA